MMLNSERRERRYLALQVNLGLKTTAILDYQNDSVLRHFDDRILTGSSIKTKSSMEPQKERRRYQQARVGKNP